MKKVIFRKSFWQSCLSIIVLVVFAYFGLATFGGISQQKYQLPDGRWEISKHYSDGNTETTTGNVDGDGRWEGPVKVEYENDNYILTHTEEVNMKQGKRHGVSKVTYPSGYVATYCYQHGERVDMEQCENTKSASLGSEENSAFNIFNYKKAWFAFKLHACGFDSSYVKAYLDTLETIIYSTEFGVEEFEDYYDDAIDVLEETAYDSIIQLNAELSIYNGLDLILDHEFRLATLYSYKKSDSNTYLVVKNIYPNYLIDLNEAGVSDSDFEGFCSEYDSIMITYDPIAIDDPYYVDSMDVRMFRTMDSIYSSDEGSATKSLSLKSAVLSTKVMTIQSFLQESLQKNRNQSVDYTPKEVSEIIISGILAKFFYGDLVRNAVREAFTINEGIISLATVVTNFADHTSSTSVTLHGNVIEDGGGEVNSRGIAWGTIYNPTIDNQILTGGTGTGDFTVTLTELIADETYYARAFATNSAGTAYGNCITFIAQSTTRIATNELSTLDVNIFPNPASDKITLTFNAKDSKGMTFTMFDLNGKVVLEQELASLVQGENNITVNLSEIKTGFYTCRLKKNEKLYAIHKLLINR